MGILRESTSRRRATALARERSAYFRMGAWIRMGGYREPTARNDLREFCGAARRIFAGCRMLSAYAHTLDESLAGEALETMVCAVAYLGGRGGAQWDAFAAGTMASDLVRRLGEGGSGSGPAPLELVESVRAELSGFFVGHCLGAVDG